PLAAAGTGRRVRRRSRAAQHPSSPGRHVRSAHADGPGPGRGLLCLRDHASAGADFPVKIVIADDEPLARERLRALLAGEPGVEVVAEVGDGHEALHACAEHDPELVLLDIAMPGIDGLEVARHLQAFEPRPVVVFCTAYDAHALSECDAEAVDYLVKPVRSERLASALQRARALAAARETGVGLAPGSKRRSHLCARLRGSLRLIPVEDVRYLQAEEKYVVVHHAR